MVIPKWLQGRLTEGDLKKFEKLIAEIETKTEAEIVPVIVRSSSNYYQARETLMLTGLLFFTLIWHFAGPELHWDAFLPSLLGALGGLAVILFVLPQLACVPRVQKLFTSRREEIDQCWKRAQIEFYENRLHHTDDQNGVLLYISMLEHMVIVLADEKISAKLPQETWGRVVDEVLAGIKAKKMGEGLEKGLHACSGLLIEAFPVKSGDRNELPNTLIIKE